MSRGAVLAGCLALTACGRIGYAPFGAPGDAGAVPGDADDPACPGVGVREARLGAALAHTLLLRSNGRLWGFGLNESGQLGLGDTAPRLAPAELMGSWRDMAAGREHSCAVDRTDVLWCWGAGGRGRLGLGDTSPRLQPARVGPRWRLVAAGAAHGCGVRHDGTLWCWGANDRGQLGLGEPGPERTLPVQVGDETTWSALSSGGGDFTCGLRGAALLCWGDGAAGQLGVGDELPRAAPAPVGGEGWQRVDVGFEHACGVRAGGTLWCWGSNESGRAGLGPAPGASVPAQVGGDADWVRVTAGVRHSCGIKRDGSLWCWGRNASGELGPIPDRSLAQATAPVPVGVEREWDEVVAGEHTCAVRGNRAYCWGPNGRGQLGSPGPGGPEPQRLCVP